MLKLKNCLKNLETFHTHQTIDAHPWTQQTRGSSDFTPSALRRWCQCRAVRARARHWLP